MHFNTKFKLPQFMAGLQNLVRKNASGEKRTFSGKCQHRVLQKHIFNCNSSVVIEYNLLFRLQASKQVPFYHWSLTWPPSVHEGWHSLKLHSPIIPSPPSYLHLLTPFPLCSYKQSSTSLRLQDRGTQGLD